MQARKMKTIRVSYRGGGTLEFHPLPKEILKLSMVIILAIYMLLNISMCHQNVVWNFVPDCVRSNLRGCKFSWGGGGGGGGHAPRPP